MPAGLDLRMDTTCIRHSEIPHTSRLYSDLIYHFDRVSHFYRHRPLDLNESFRAAAGLRFPEDRRAALVAALRRSNGESRSLDLLELPGTVAVVTGQQVGLFSGPAYTIYKALTVARLSAWLNERGINAVPVFWLATEDHDFAEVDHCWVPDGGSRPVRLRLANGGPPQTPVGDIRLEGVPAADLRRLLGQEPFGEEVLQIVEEAYQPGQTMGGAFTTLLQRLLSGYGFLFVDPLDPAIRELAAPLLRDAVDAMPELMPALQKRNGQLEAQGYHAQVHIEAETSLFFLLDGGRRLTLKRQNGGYAARDRRFSPEELKERAAHLSPNALLRPVVQDYILPTAAYSGGPAELAYFAQSEVLYQRLLGRMPVVMPRSGFTLIDERAGKLMAKYHLTLEDALHGEHVLRERIARTLVPPSLQSTFAESSASVGRALDRLSATLREFDVTLAAALEKSRAKMLYQLSKVEGKASREAMRRDERAASDAACLSGLLFPERHLQERLYSILPFLARHGLDLVDRVYENVHLECPDHTVLTL